MPKLPPAVIVAMRRDEEHRYLSWILSFYGGCRPGTVLYPEPGYQLDWLTTFTILEGTDREGTTELSNALMPTSQACSSALE
jgi:hypothetical protein